MRVYATAVDFGDGSVGIRFFDDYRTIEKLMELDPETYRGEGWETLELDYNNGLTIISMADALEDYK